MTAPVAAETVLEPHHDSSERYLSDPNPSLGDTVTAFVAVPAGAGVERVVARVVHDGEPVRLEATPDRTTATERWWRVDLEVRNPLTSYRFHLTDDRGATAWLTGEGPQRWDVPDTADFRLSTDHQPPDWVRRTVWYQIFPDRFARRADGRIETEVPEWAWTSEWDEPICTDRDRAMTQLFGGSLNGIADRLDHLDDLGVTGIYTCPFFPARSNHRYDATSFDRIDPLLGGDDGLRRLVAEAGARGIRVVGDLTLNHTGRHHPWFTDAVADPTGPTRSFYAFGPDGAYESWLGVPTLPKLDHTSAELRRRLYEGEDSVAARLVGDDIGLAGLRVDAANMTGRLRGSDRNRSCAQALRETLAAVRPDAWLLAEHVHDASPDLDGAGWHGTMNYAGFARPAWAWLRRPDVDVYAFGEPGPLPLRSGPEIVRSARAFLARIPYSVALTNLNLLGSHDTARWIHATGSSVRSEVGVAFLCTWPGTPSIFAGDEIGIGAGATYDVTTRIPFPWHDRASWDEGLLAAHRELFAVRTSSSALATGGLRWVAVGADHLVYLRESADERLLVHLARADHEPLDLPLAALGAAGAEPIAGAPAVVDPAAIRLETSGPTWRILRLLDRS